MITLGVRDLAASVAFYAQGLGLPRMESPPEVAFFTLDGTWLGLYGRQALAEDATVPAEGSGFTGVTLAHNVASEAEVDALLKQAVAAGGRWSSRVRGCSGAATRATSPTRTATSGRWRTTRTSGLARRTATSGRAGVRPGSAHAREVGDQRGLGALDLVGDV